MYVKEVELLSRSFILSHFTADSFHMEDLDCNQYGRSFPVFAFKIYISQAGAGKDLFVLFKVIAVFLSIYVLCTLRMKDV